MIGLFFPYTLKVRPIFLDLLEEQLCIHFSSECVLSESAQISWYSLAIINLPMIFHNFWTWFHSQIIGDYGTGWMTAVVCRDHCYKMSDLYIYVKNGSLHALQSPYYLATQQQLMSAISLSDQKLVFAKKDRIYSLELLLLHNYLAFFQIV